MEEYEEYEQEGVVERYKCRATGKVRFVAKSEARFFIHWLKWKYKTWLKTPNRQKGYFNSSVGGARANPRYVYHCKYCKGYHITKMQPYKHEKRQKSI